MSSSPFIGLFAQKSNNFNDLPWCFDRLNFPETMAAVSGAKMYLLEGEKFSKRAWDFLACYSASQSLLKYINTKSTKLYLVSLYFQTLHKILVPQHIYGTEMRWITTRIGLAHCSVLANWTTSLFHLSRGPLFHYGGSQSWKSFYELNWKIFETQLLTLSPLLLGILCFKASWAKVKCGEHLQTITKALWQHTFGIISMTFLQPNFCLSSHKLKKMATLIV